MHFFYGFNTLATDASEPPKVNKVQTFTDMCCVLDFAFYVHVLPCVTVCSMADLLMCAHAALL